MPLVSLPLIGCVAGHAPSSRGSRHADVPGPGRGTGGNGNGADCHSIPRGCSGTRARHARHNAYATPPTSPAPTALFTPFGIPEFCHASLMRDVDAAEQGLTHAGRTDRLIGLMRKETTTSATLLGLLLM